MGADLARPLEDSVRVGKEKNVAVVGCEASSTVTLTASLPNTTDVEGKVAVTIIDTADRTVMKGRALPIDALIHTWCLTVWESLFGIIRQGTSVRSYWGKARQRCKHPGAIGQGPRKLRPMSIGK